MKTHNVVEVKHGKWIRKYDKIVNDYYNACTLCNGASTIRSNYCPNCGAKMEDKDKDITLKEYLLHKTPTNRLCWITDNGWGRCVAYIDSEDIMTTSIPENFLSKTVKSADEQYTIRVANNNGNYVEIPVLKIEIG